nr:hypothetical protein [Tanacetum cinerariifolium]
MMGDVSDQKVPIPEFTITLVSNQEKSPDLLSHRGFEIFQPSAECPMKIHGKNIPTLDIPIFHFYPLDQLKYGGVRLSIRDSSRKTKNDSDKLETAPSAVSTSLSFQKAPVDKVPVLWVQHQLTSTCGSYLLTKLLTWHVGPTVTSLAANDYIAGVQVLQ